NGNAWARSLVLDQQDEDYFYVQDAINALTTKTAGMAILRVNNQGSDAMHLIMDNIPVKSPTGITYFRGIKDFPIDLSIPNTKDGFETQKTITCKFGPNAREVDVVSSSGSKNLVLKADKLYTVIVTGDQNTSISAVVELDEEAESGGPTAIVFDWL
ncbi:MAG: hypothetical protein LBB72_03955, partial [Spirochaetaceae bacterium]|nr:hypothetical protein [Spirochaetaceae bacterium]